MVTDDTVVCAAPVLRVIDDLTLNNVRLQRKLLNGGYQEVIIDLLVLRR